VVTEELEALQDASVELAPSLVPVVMLHENLEAVLVAAGKLKDGEEFAVAA
jgi:hypothetical protein